MKAITALIGISLTWHVLAADYRVTFLPESSATYPSNTTFGTFVADTEDPFGPFEDKPCTFRGFNQGGSAVSVDGAHLIYRMRIDFAEEVVLHAFSEIGAGGQQAPSWLRVLDTNYALLRSTQLVEYVNVLVTNRIVLGLRGRAFLIESADQSTDWRWRKKFSLAYTPVSAVPLTIQTALVAISWPSENGASYQVQYSSTPGTWFDLGPPVTGDGGTRTLFEDALNRDRMFYRVIKLHR